MNPFETDQLFSPLYDIARFHEKFGLENNQEKVQVAPPEPESLSELDNWKIENRERMHPEEWRLRNTRLIDEAIESQVAHESGNDEEYLDALVDIVYIALGTAYRRGWDFAAAWKRVHDANMAKERGKPNNSKYGSGFDIVKPQGWQPPSHADLV